MSERYCCANICLLISLWSILLFRRNYTKFIVVNLKTLISDIETWSVSGIDDTWIFVLVASSIGVLLLGALLAMFLLKCRE